MQEDLCLGCDGRGFTKSYAPNAGERWTFDVCDGCGGNGKHRSIGWGRLLAGILGLVILAIVVF